MMAGLAIIMMIFLHITTHPEWLDPGVEWDSVFGDIGKSAITILGIFSGICVQIYALLSGYALMVNSRAYGTWRKRIRRLLKFLLAYWIVNVLFLAIGYINGDTLPGLKEILLNLVGLKAAPEQGWINVPFAWYVSYYIEFIILSPLLIWAFSSKQVVIDIIVAVIAAAMVLTAVRMPYEALINLWPLLSAILGILIAKYGIFSKLHRLITGRMHWALIIFAIALVIIVRYEYDNHNLPGIILALPVVAAVVILLSIELFQRLRSRRIQNTLLLLGDLSMFVWFLHGIFFTGKNLMQGFIFSFKEPILILVAILIILLPIAWLLKRVHTIIIKRLFHV